MLRAFTATVFVLLTFVSSAHAIQLVAPDGQPATLYQNIVNRYLHGIPTANQTVMITGDVQGRCLHNDGGYALGDVEGCAGPGWIALRSHDANALAHELGHVFDFDVLTDQDRAEFQAIVGNARPWVDTADYWESPNEQFAEAYRDCAVYGMQVTAWDIASRYAYSYEPSVKTQRTVCHMIRSLSAQAMAS